MRTLKQIIFMVMITLLVNGCVSKKKYNDAVTSKFSWEKKYNNLNADYRDLQKEKNRADATASQELKDREHALLLEENRMKEMKAMIEAQRDAITNLKKEVCSALKCFTPDELSIEVRNGKLYVSLSDKLLFPSGSDQVNKRGTEAISMLAAVLANSDLEVMVEGHTDPIPINTARNKDNWDLSAHRATSVTRIFAENGIPESRIIAAGRGEFQPVADNSFEEGRQQNRRTEIVLAPKLDKLWKLTEMDQNKDITGSEHE